MNSENNHPAFPHIVATQESAYERGKQIGERTKALINWSLETYEKTFALCDINWSKAIELSKPYLEACSELPAPIVEELEGLAAGSAIDFDSLWALNSRTEILPPDFLRRAHAMAKDESISPESSIHDRNSSIDPFPNECTSLAVSGEGFPVWLAQNWDWCGRQRKAMCVIERQSSSTLKSITVTEAGMLAKIGLNNQGFGISLNILRSQDDGQQSGVPVHVLLKTLLDCCRVGEAVDLVSSLNFASSSNILIADKAGASASLELSPAGMKIVGQQNSLICHTNHFLDQSLIDKDTGRHGNSSTMNRLKRAEAHVDSQMSFDDIKTLLSNTDDGMDSICRFPDKRLPDVAQVETVTAVIMNLSTQTLSVSAAQPNISEFQKYSIR